MRAVVMLRGLPGSGKSTWAAEWVAEYPLRRRVNRDALREMIVPGATWTPEFEATVVALEEEVAHTLLRHGFSVVVDDTNLKPEDEERWREVALVEGVRFELADEFLTVPLEECVVRDAARAHPVGRSVIETLWNRWLERSAA